jgi:hypothetical protein
MVVCGAARVCLLPFVALRALYGLHHDRLVTVSLALGALAANQCHVLAVRALEQLFTVALVAVRLHVFVGSLC